MFLPAVLASFGLVTSSLYSFQCESIKFEAQQESDFYSDLHFSVFYQKETRYVESPAGSYLIEQKSCVEWTTDPNMDSTFKFVRVCAVLAPIIGGLLAIILWFRYCLAGRISKGAWRGIACIYAFFVAPLQGLTFLLYRSNACQDNSVVARMEEDFERNDLFQETCEWDEGSTANVFSVFLWFATAIAMLWVGTPVRPAQGPAEHQTVSYERNVLPDGSTAVHETVVVKGKAVEPSAKV